MSATITLKQFLTSTTDGNSADIPSWTPVSGRAYIILTSADKGTAVCPEPTVTGNTITWTLIASALFDGSTCRVSAWYGIADGSATAGVTTIDYGEGMDNFLADVYEIDGANNASLIRQFKVLANNTASAPTITFDQPTLAANSLLAVGVRTATTSTITGPTGWTALSGRSVSTPSGFWRSAKLEAAADDTTDWDIASSPDTSGFIQLEINVAGGGSIENYDSGTGRGINRGINRGVA